MKVVIDRFEGEYAVVEMPDKLMVNVPKILFNGVTEGSVVDISIDEKETVKRKDQMQSKLNSLWKD